MGSIPQRTSLGEGASIGTLYDGKNDVFLPSNLFTNSLPSEAITISDTQAIKVRVDDDHSYKAKFQEFSIEPTLANSIIAKSVECHGAACYFSESNDLDRWRGWTALYHIVCNAKAQLNLTSSGLKDYLVLNPPHLQAATHVVTAIDYGIRTIITTNYRRGKNRDTEVSETQDFALRSEMDRLKSAIDDASDSFMADAEYLTDGDYELDITAYSDVLSDTGIYLQDLNEAFDFLNIVPIQMKQTGRGIGSAYRYYLFPLETLSMFLSVHVSTPSVVPKPPEDCMRSLVKLFDELREAIGSIVAYSLALHSKRQFVLPDHLGQIENQLLALRNAEADVKSTYPLALRSFRATGDPVQLCQLLEKYTRGEASVRLMKTFDRSELEAATMFSNLVADGAVYVGRNDSDPKVEISRHAKSNVFILNFSRSFLGSDTWNANYGRFLQLLRSVQSGDPLVCFIVDHDARSGHIDHPHIDAYQMGQEVTTDLIEHEAFMAQRSFAYCDSKTLESKDIQKPIKRRLVSIPCPRSNCNRSENKDWTCVHCFAAIEYGFSDDYIYCDCGRSKYTNYSFKCNGGSHDSQYHRYDSATLYKLLRGLQSSNYLNILILGETGVGKSTFINALINYLEFETLDDALDNDELSWVIPCSFSTQIMDRSNANSEIVERSIQVGSRADEKDGSKGESATQQTTVYSVMIPSSTSSTGFTCVRLIDTPGIGDTRGIDYDRKNMADILSTLSSYDELHGILILLKSNAARLTITFQYCVKELLTHLHHSAAQNMVFGFTNTRISNYTPGDTFSPLKKLLGENRDVGLELSIKTTYCFDSESFRYLAAAKNGVIMPNKKDFDRSWEHSRDETNRLIAHFRTVTPHETRSTMSLNGARRNISELTKPMAEIAQVIRTNIALCEDKREELKDMRITGDQLRGRLDVDKVFMEAKKLGRPRTVCTNSNCIEIKDNGYGQQVVDYKTHCHAECYIKGVDVDVIAPPGLINCAAFTGGRCDLCHHHWQEHQHVLYELEEHIKTVKDVRIQQQLKAHADDITLRQTAIQNTNQRIAEYEAELEIIRVAAAKFGVFLKKYSITPYNDALVAYLEFLIKTESDKVQAGGNSAKLEALKDDLARHHQTVKVLTRSMNMDANATDINEAGVQRTVQDLYALKHFGKMLENLKHGIVEAHESTYRERPHTVRRGNIGRSGAPKLQIRNPQTVYQTKSGGHLGGQHTSRRTAPEPQPGIMGTIRGIWGGR